MRCLLLALVLGVLGSFAAPARADFPKPNPYPLSWELKFEHGTPRRISVLAPGTNSPQAYWYMTFTVTNKTDKDIQFLPVIEMVSGDGKVVRSNDNIPLAVFNAIKDKERKPFLEQLVAVTGILRVGEEQARDSVAIWPEVNPRMGQFQIYVQGLCGEYTKVKGPDGKETILRKTLQLNYFIRGDEVYPGEDVVNDKPEQWIMR